MINARARSLFIAVRGSKLKHKLYCLLAVQLLILLIWYGLSLWHSHQEFTARAFDICNLTNETMSQQLATVISAMETTTKFPMICSSEGQFPEINEYLSSSALAARRPELIYQSAAAKASELMSAQDFMGHVVILGLDRIGIDAQKYAKYEWVFSPILPASLSAAATRKGASMLRNGADAALPFLPQSARQMQIVLIRTIVGGTRFRNIGYIVASSDVTTLHDRFLQDKPFSSSRLIVYDETGTPFWGTASDTEDYQIAQAQRIGTALPEGSLFANGHHYSYRYDDNTKTLCVLRTDLNDINATFLSANTNFFVMFVLLLLFSVFFLIYVIHSVTQPVTQLATACEELRRGNYAARVDIPNDADLRPTAEAFNRMADELNYWINEVYSRKMTAQKLEIQTLRAQINPHFLYNTLESLRMSAYTAQQYQLADMLVLLGKLFRYGIDSINEEVPLSAEISNVEEYLALQRLRYGNLFSFFLHYDEYCEPDLLSCLVLKMLLQPLVENCITHGFAGITGKGRMELMIYTQEDCLRIDITDNGCGIEPQRLERLRTHLSAQDDLLDCIGLKNVHRRMLLTYGAAYGIEIHSVVNRGTIISLRLPIQGRDA